MIIKACVGNFKAIGNACVEFSEGLNVIVGPPSSGKSSMLEAITLIMQSRGEDALIIEGRLLMIHDVVDVLRNLDTSSRVTVSLRFSIDDQISSFLKDTGINANSGSITYSYSFIHSSGNVEQEVWLNDNLLVTFGRINDKNMILKPEIIDLCITPYHIMHEDALETCSDPPDSVKVAKAVLFSLRQGLRDRFFFIGENRLAWWKRTFETTVDLLPDYSVGGDAQYTVHQLSRMLTVPSYREQVKEILSEMQSLNVEDVTAGFIAPNRLMGFIKAKGSWGVLYNAGLGVRSILPLIVQLVLAPRGSTIIIDGVDIGLNEESLENVLSAVGKYAKSKDLQIIASSRLRPRVNDAKVIELNNQ
ncbi:AAA family ATPase [Caldivirga maquilingensis]|uniref:AAA family ATPase n=1 Tax=Caldivirga maquilingensis TaxID=76887 RepID=UPI00064EFD60|nr:AAA family ATPase [Caldivirga maquilingensis]